MKNVIVEANGALATIRLNRPNERNAFNEALIAELRQAFADLPAAVRVVVLTGEGAAFCAGADLRWMQASAQFSAADNRRDAQNLAGLFKAVDEAPQVVIGKINGVAMGGGLGLIACCDLVVAVDTARFGFTEVRLGLAPAVISPYVLRKVGMSHARRYFVTGELFGAHTAYGMALVHKVVEPDRLDHAVSEWVDAAVKCGPQAVRATKELLRNVAACPPAEVDALVVDTIARLRVSAEGQEGLTAFLQKRKPNWVV